MVIDFKRFAKTKTVIAPIIKNRGTYQGRKFLTTSAENGFYKVKLSDATNYIEKADILDVQELLGTLPSLRGYVFGTEVIPESFNTVKIKFELTASSIQVNLMDTIPWSFVEIVQWEDGNWFHKRCLMNAPEAILDVQTAFEKETDLKGIKGVTPEMRYLYFLFSFDRDASKELKRLQELAISEEERKQRLEEFKKTIGGRLRDSIERAGGHLIRFTKQGISNLEVVWSVGGEKLHSIINSNTFRCVDTGFCVSGGDSKLNIMSAIVTVKDHIKEDILYKTRE